MSSIVAIANAVRGRFASQVVTPLSLVAIYDNATTPLPPETGRWCRFSVLFGTQAQADFGATSRRYRMAGVALAQLYEPVGIGDGAQLAVVSTIQDAFRGVTVTGPPHVHFSTPYVSAPPTRDEPWWQIVVTIPFRADEFSA